MNLDKLPRRLWKLFQPAEGIAVKTQYHGMATSRTVDTMSNPATYAGIELTAPPARPGALDYKRYKSKGV